MKKFTTIFLYAGAALLIACGLQSCSGGKTAVKPLPVISSEPVAEVTPAQAAQDLRAMLASYSPQWQRVKMPVNLSVTAPKQIGASGTVTMERGRLIAISMRVLGMEIASLTLQGDSILVIDRWNKRYLFEDIRRVLSGFPVNISNVQDLLMGRVFVVGNSGLTEADASLLKVEAGEGLWGCEPVKADPRYQYAFVCAAEALVALEAEVKAGGAGAQYGEPAATPYGPFASSITIATKSAKKPVSGILTWNFDRAKWDGDVSVPAFKVPAGYKRINASDLIGKLGAP